MADTAAATTEHELAIAALDLARLGATHTASLGRRTLSRAVDRGRRLRRRAGTQARGRAPEVLDRLREAGYSVWSNESRWSFASVRSQGSMWSVLSLWSAGSVASAGSLGSVLSIGSAGSVLSIGSAGSILSIGSAGSVLAIGGVNERPRWLQSDDGRDLSPALALVDRGGMVLGALALAAVAVPGR